MRGVTTQTCIYTDPDLKDWRPLTIYYYRYLYENEHVDGIMGVGRIRDAVVRVETRMTRLQIERATEQIGNKVQWFADGSYWVVGRINHTCKKGTGEWSPKMLAAFKARLPHFPPEIQKSILYRYPMDTLSVGDTPVPTVRGRARANGTVSVSVSVPVSGTVSVSEKEKETTCSQEPEKSPPLDRVPYQKILESWNDFARKQALPTIRRMTETRKRKLKARWREWGEGDAEGAADALWQDVLRAIPEQPFLLGQNDRGWRVTLDFVLRSADTSSRILERAYPGGGSNREPETKKF